MGAGARHRQPLPERAKPRRMGPGMACKLLKFQVNFAYIAGVFWMALERTLSIIKPDAVKKNVIGQILARFERAGLRIVAARMTHLSRAQAEGFYAVHRSRPFFKDLVEFMISGPVLIQVLEGDNAITR